MEKREHLYLVPHCTEQVSERPAFIGAKLPQVWQPTEDIYQKLGNHGTMQKLNRILLVESTNVGFTHISHTRINGNIAPVVR